MANDTILPRVWITSYALSSGVTVRENVEHCVGTSDKMVSFKNEQGYGTYCHKPHWHTSEAEAKAQVRKMIAAKRKSIEKSLKKLDELEKQYK